MGKNKPSQSDKSSKMKRCNKCKRILTHDQFYKNKKGKYGLHGKCKNCRDEIIQIYRQANKDKIRERMKRYRDNNKDKIRILNKKYHQNNSEYAKTYRLEHLEKIRKYLREYNYERRKSNPKHKLNRNISHAIRKSLKRKHISKNGRHWESLVNFTLEDLRNHLKNQFQIGMTWENMNKWHIDHIKPISLFNFQSTNDPEFKECWDLNNLQPLWAEDNIRKHNKYIEI